MAIILTKSCRIEINNQNWNICSKVLYMLCYLETMRDPSLLKWTALTGSECAGRVFRHFPVRTSHIRTLSSKEPETTWKYGTIVKVTQWIFILTLRTAFWNKLNWFGWKDNRQWAFKLRPKMLCSLKPKPLFNVLHVWTK